VAGGGAGEMNHLRKSAFPLPPKTGIVAQLVIASDAKRPQQIR
jgi:hypothetical protein